MRHTTAYVLLTCVLATVLGQMGQMGQLGPTKVLHSNRTCAINGGAHTCAMLPCSLESCPQRPKATCKNYQCGDVCQAEFWINDLIDVTKECQSGSAQHLFNAVFSSDPNAPLNLGRALSPSPTPTDPNQALDSLLSTIDLTKLQVPGLDLAGLIPDPFGPPPGQRPPPKPPVPDSTLSRTPNAGTSSGAAGSATAGGTTGGGAGAGTGTAVGGVAPAPGPAPQNNGCPGGKPRVRCLKRPCEVSACPALPTATCKDDYCGGCYAKYFQGQMEVTLRCHQRPQQPPAPPKPPQQQSQMDIINSLLGAAGFAPPAPQPQPQTQPQPKPQPQPQPRPRPQPQPQPPPRPQAPAKNDPHAQLNALVSALTQQPQQPALPSLPQAGGQLGALASLGLLQQQQQQPQPPRLPQGLAGLANAGGLAAALAGLQQQQQQPRQQLMVDLRTLRALLNRGAGGLGALGRLQLLQRPRPTTNKLLGKCPIFTTIKQCAVSPCLTNFCHNIPAAECQDYNCGKCSAKFFFRGKEVTHHCRNGGGGGGGGRMSRPLRVRPRGPMSNMFSAMMMGDMM